MKNKTSVRLSLSPEAIAQLKQKARLNGFLWGEKENISSLIEAWAMGQLDKEIKKSIADLTEVVDFLAKII
ncbi:MAG: hypothetical protein ACKPGB_30105 [Dolichospermum sp.]